MSNMKRLWEELPEEEKERMMREGGLTEDTIERISKWMNKVKDVKNDKSE